MGEKAKKHTVQSHRHPNCRSGFRRSCRPGLGMVAFCCLLSFILVSCTSPPISTSQLKDNLVFDEPVQISVSEEDLPPIPSLPSKLIGSSEYVDGNGIVHGTTPGGINYTVHGRGTLGYSQGKVSLCAVGDQLATDMSLPFADWYAGDYGDGLYDFTPFYREIAPMIQSYDLRYINQETVMAGYDGYGYSGYPSFNSPDNMAETIANVGFNLVGFATNHIYDMGLYGVEHSHEVWARFPQLLIGGSYLTQEDRETVHMIERNGITFAFLSYTYGDNNYGYGTENMPNAYYSCQFDYDLMTADVRRAQQVADVVIVSLHWGDEYLSDPSPFQYDYAMFMADLGVDLVLGSHAHIIQPVQYITGYSGNTIPVVFGLSDIVSGWTLTDTIFSAIFTCDFVRLEDGSFSVENLLWYPTIEWSDGGDVYVRMLKDMDEYTININTRTEDVYDDYNYLRDMVYSIGMEIPIVM